VWQCNQQGKSKSHIDIVMRGGKIVMIPKINKQFYDHSNKFTKEQKNSNKIFCHTNLPGHNSHFVSANYTGNVNYFIYFLLPIIIHFLLFFTIVLTTGQNLKLR
jgi:hypothetical protein